MRKEKLEESGEFAHRDGVQRPMLPSVHLWHCRSRAPVSTLSSLHARGLDKHMSDQAKNGLRPGLREQTTEKVLLVCRAPAGGIRIDWWPSIEEAHRHDMKVLEVRDRVTLPAKAEATGLWKLAETILGRGASQDRLIHKRGTDQKEYFNR